MDLLSALNKRKEPRKPSDFNVHNMLSPLGDRPKRMMEDIDQANLQPKKENLIKLKLNPSTGRSVNIQSGVDVGRGFRLLEMSCSRNKIRGDANKQRFHERGGMKRKRLRRERWRKRFMDGFKATVGRVKQLKNQGW